MICPFCLKEVPDFHSNSHIIPEWMYENSYDDKHRAVSLNLDDLKKDLVQQGLRGSFICSACEVKFSKDDDFGCQLLTKKVKNSKVQKDLIVETKICQLEIGNTEVSFWRNFEFKKFQNFIFSILIRNHLWKRTSQEKRLNEDHFQKIKYLYLNEALIDDVSYPIVIVKLIESTTSFKHPPVLLPYIGRFFGDQNAYVFTGA